jgi:hypothetical protein
MKTLYEFVLFMMIVILMLAACGDGDSGKKTNMSGYLPEKFDIIGLQRSSEIRIFSGQSLWEYINGGADLYLMYNFIEVITADYMKGETEMVVDLYRFASPEDAYGVYSMLRSPGVQIIRLGMEGFLAPASVNFVRGEYLVRLTGYDESTESSLALVNLAGEINKLLPGRSELPAEFGLFPIKGKIDATDKYYVESFMGQKFLTQVYSRYYVINDDSLTLFLSEDKTGSKFLEWSQLTEKLGSKITDSVGLPFDNGHGFAFEDSFHGTIVIGLKGGRLAGMMNFTDERKVFFAFWLQDLQSANH